MSNKAIKLVRKLSKLRRIEKSALATYYKHDGVGLRAQKAYKRYEEISEKADSVEVELLAILGDDV